jgi:hypothetical protein
VLLMGLRSDLGAYARVRSTGTGHHRQHQLQGDHREPGSLLNRELDSALLPLPAWCYGSPSPDAVHARAALLAGGRVPAETPRTSTDATADAGLEAVAWTSVAAGIVDCVFRP